MCGIVGLVGGVANEDLAKLVKVMNAAIEHRGPDGDGYYLEGNIAMAMRRLSIIDLEHGWQPLFGREKRIVAFQNGEIYNFIELKKELSNIGYSFLTNSDTEVISHGYDAWGIEALLQRLDGMFAIALLDKDEQCLYLARDRFGEKPLYYCQFDECFAYSSDLLTLASLPAKNSEYNGLALERYLALHYVPGKETLFKGIYRVLPGEFLRIPIHATKEYHRYRYFLQKLSASRRISDNELVLTIEKSVVSRLVADVPLGVFLSGGLDSSIIAAIAAKKSPGINTFSMGFESTIHDESLYSRQVAELIGSTHHHFTFKTDNFVDLLPKVAEALDEPVGDQAALPLYWLCREARRHVKVALAGEGADEIFAGYGYYQTFVQPPSYLRRLMNTIAKKKNIHMSLIGNSLPVTPSGFPVLTNLDERLSILGAGSAISDVQLDEWESLCISWLDAASNSLQRATAADLATWLPDDLLIKFDRMAMAHGLEGRAPFLSPKLVDMALHLPPAQRMDKHSSKIALRRVAQCWLPDEVLKRPKQGFVLPMREWIIEWFSYHGSVDAYFRKRAFNGLDTDEIIKIVHADMADGVQRERLLFAIIMLYEWQISAQRKMALLRRSYAACM